MKFTKTYTGTEEQMLAEALEDIKYYLGEQFNEVNDLMKEATSQREFEIAASMVGVQGYPVIAWYESIFGKDSSWKDEDEDADPTRT